jgi:hypothetical protein
MKDFNIEIEIDDINYDYNNKYNDNDNNNQNLKENFINKLNENSYLKNSLFIDRKKKEITSKIIKPKNISFDIKEKEIVNKKKISESGFINNEKFFNKFHKEENKINKSTNLINKINKNKKNKFENKIFTNIINKIKKKTQRKNSNLYDINNFVVNSNSNKINEKKEYINIPIPVFRELEDDFYLIKNEKKVNKKLEDLDINKKTNNKSDINIQLDSDKLLDNNVKKKNFFFISIKFINRN